MLEVDADPACLASIGVGGCQLVTAINHSGHGLAKDTVRERVHLDPQLLPNWRPTAPHPSWPEPYQSLKQVLVWLPVGGLCAVLLGLVVPLFGLEASALADPRSAPSPCTRGSPCPASTPWEQ